MQIIMNKFIEVNFSVWFGRDAVYFNPWLPVKLLNNKIFVAQVSKNMNHPKCFFIISNQKRTFTLLFKAQSDGGYRSNKSINFYG